MDRQPAIRFGRGQYRLAQAIETVQFRWCGVPRYMFREMLMQVIAIVRGLLGRDEEGLFRARWQFNHVRGQVMEARVIRREHALTSTHQKGDDSLR